MSRIFFAAIIAYLASVLAPVAYAKENNGRIVGELYPICNFNAKYRNRSEEGTPKYSPFFVHISTTNTPKILFCIETTSGDEYRNLVLKNNITIVIDNTVTTPMVVATLIGESQSESVWFLGAKTGGPNDGIEIHISEDNYNEWLQSFNIKAIQK